MINNPRPKKRKFDQSGLNQSKNTDFDSLLARLAHIKEQRAPSELMQVVSQRELDSLLGYFEAPKQGNVRTRRRQQSLLAQNQIAMLKPGEAYRLNKKVTKLPRTMTMLRHPKGEYSLIGETKSKLANGKKRKLKKVGGSFKKGKPCWRLDTNTSYFNLVTKLEDENAINGIKQEVAISQQLASDYVNETQLGPIFDKDGVNQVSVYSPLAKAGTLESLIKSGTLTLEQIDSLTRQLLLGLKYIHDRDIIHQDLKPANILVDGDAEHGYFLKYTDFGNYSLSHNSDVESLSTWHYASPEIVQFYRDEETSQYAFFHECELDSASYSSTQPEDKCIPNSWGKPHKANDIWALGIIIFEMRHGRTPIYPDDTKMINDDPLLKGMLASKRRSRITIDGAIDNYDESNAVKELASLKRKLT